jgi:protocatechuate 3,4-dioxygenase alpha subunit
MRRAATPSQTIGPFHHHALPLFGSGHMATPQTIGSPIRLIVRISDGTGARVDDALLECWQANAAGRYRHPEDRRNLPLDENFRGFGRVMANAAGDYIFETIKPGSVPDAEGRPQAPHINLSIFARGLLDRLVTRVYFGDESEANAFDALLGSVPPARRETLLAQRDAVTHDYVFVIRLRGDAETVFFAP